MTEQLNRTRQLVCCWCNERVWGGRLIPGWGYLLQPCGHVSYPREVE